MKREPRPGHIECPHCAGTGTTPDGPRKGCSCWSCWGWGDVEPGSPGEICAHDFITDRNIGRCLNVWKCTKCGFETTVDSSD